MNKSLINPFSEENIEEINKTIEILKAHDTVKISYSRGDMHLDLSNLDTARVKFIEQDRSMEIATRDFVIRFDLIGSDIFVIESGEYEWDTMNLITFDNGDSYLTLYMFDGE